MSLDSFLVSDAVQARATFPPRKLGKIKFPRSAKVVEKFFTQRAFDWYHCHLKWTSPSSKFITPKFDETPEKCRLESQKSNFSFVFVIRQPNVPGFFLISDRRTYWSGFHFEIPSKVANLLWTPFFHVSRHFRPKSTPQWPPPYLKV